MENKHGRGFFAHSTLGVSTEGIPLGLLGQKVWARLDEEAGKAARRHERSFEDKESYKWVEGLPKLEPSVNGPTVISVSDQESHVYEYLDAVLTRQMQFIVRGTAGRGYTEDGQALFAAIADQPVQHRYQLHLQRRPDREPRDAQVELRYMTLVIRRPKRAKGERDCLTVQVVEVIEPTPPADEQAVHWVLLTSLPVDTVEQALTVVRFYTYRWLIERFHFTLKSGCKLEERQLSEAIRLERLLAVFSLVAWRLLWLTYQARQTPDAPCTVALQQGEWQALFAFIHRTQRIPADPPSLHQAVRWIAQLGGFLGRKGDGEPGVKVLWRGWSRLQDIIATWTISHPISKNVGNA